MGITSQNRHFYALFYWTTKNTLAITFKDDFLHCLNNIFKIFSLLYTAFLQKASVPGKNNLSCNKTCVIDRLNTTVVEVVYGDQEARECGIIYTRAGPTLTDQTYNISCNGFHGDKVRLTLSLNNSVGNPEPLCIAEIYVLGKKGFVK